MPIRLRQIDVVILRSLLDVREGKSTIGIGHTDHLIESRDRIAHVAGIGQRLFALFWKREDRVGQIALPGEEAVPFMGFPCCFYRFH